MNALLQHFAFEFRTGVRNKTVLFLTYLFPLALYLILGSLMTAVNPQFRETLIPAMVMLAILAGTLLSVPDTLVSARQAGIFRSYKINGVPALALLSMPAVSALVHILIITACITFSAPLVFAAPLPTNWAGFLLTVVLAVAACAALSLLIGVIASGTQSTVLWAQLIFVPSMILGGLMMPQSMLPPALATIARLMPTTYAMSAFSGLAFNTAPAVDPGWSLLILLAGSVIAFGWRAHCSPGIARMHASAGACRWRCWRSFPISSACCWRDPPPSTARRATETKEPLHESTPARYSDMPGHAASVSALLSAGRCSDVLRREPAESRPSCPL